MIKQTLTYKDYDNNTIVEDFYFNIAKHEILDNMDLQGRFEDLVEVVKKNETLTQEQIRSVLGLIKDLIDISYGERSEDGKKFRKSPAILDDFKASAAYDEFLFYLFQDPERANNFMVGVFPNELREQAEKQLSASEKDLREMSKEELVALMKAKSAE